MSSLWRYKILVSHNRTIEMYPLSFNPFRSEKILAYDGSDEVLVYHPEPPYNHKVIVENPDNVYLVRLEEAAYKLQFVE